ncbi:MAG: UDP-N-acetylmuramoyl-L-alanyl-D-glutamate--2,6-diaminopimelate ligase [Actinobacteria bacterium]|nr:UDP-N-acetylmuramoyl-L-alanyl-D-glutamate--2,6-diaminopimelate ligase [Actinomycetota bacterium]
MIRPVAEFESKLSAIAALVGEAFPTQDVAITGLTNQSSEVEAGDLFIALPGLKVHGANFAGDAERHGARAILTDTAGKALAHNAGIPLIVVVDPRKSAGVISSWFFSEPMRDMYAVGITGTNGKTTTSTLLAQIWTLAEREVGLIGTIETRIGKEVFASKRTTPESSELQSLVSTMRERHVRNLVMEVSSHAIALERMRGAHFSAVAFTNLTQDHLDFHRNMEEYFNTKAALFQFEYAEKAYVNIDDPYGQKLISQSQIPITKLSRTQKSAEWHYVGAHPVSAGYEIAIRGVGGVLIEGHLPLQGDYNLDNALMAIAMAVESGVDPLFMSTILPSLSGATGRLEPVAVGQEFRAFVDYAHSPDAVTRVLETCKRMTKGKVIAVLGCGGDRDSLKRPLMGRALFAGSDTAIFTSDNPRSEDPNRILQQMVGEITVVAPSAIIPDRAAAIQYAVDQAVADDVVIVLGKGHEQGQESNGEVFPFDDRSVLAQSIENFA